MNYELKTGCSSKVLKGLDSDIIDLVVTSPPYDKLRKYDGFSESWCEEKYKEIINELFRVVKDGGVVVWIVQDSVINGSETGTSFKQALYFMSVGFRLYDTMIWNKPSPQAPTEGRYYDVFEYMFVFSKGKPKSLNLLSDRKNKTHGQKSKKESRSCREDRVILSGVRVVGEYCRRFNVWDVSRGINKTKHPAVFPLKLAEDHVLSWSNAGDLVLDPFSGSGTTGMASVSLGRNYIGIDINPEYIVMSKERIDLAFKKQNDLFTVEG